MAESVKHVMEKGMTFDLADGAQLVVAPATGYLFGEPSRPAALYMAIIGQDGVSQAATLTQNEARHILSFFGLQIGVLV